MITSHTLCNERIAELEADADKQFKLRARAEAELAALREALTDERRLTNEATASRKKAEAELAALKERRCVGCKWYDIEINRLDCNLDIIVDGSTPNAEEFCCIAWEARP